ncbi:MAG: PLP-dependent transferase [Candidatus Obscuribacterales bacterium]|nr:PLP-dependent transferase [Candidatus Obscuribacterales bacterium]
MVEKCWAVKTKNDPMVIPSYETISFTLPTMESWEDLLSGKEPGWVYLSDGNPTLAALETLLAKLQGTETCWVTSTGKSAIAATLLALLQKDDHLILLKEGYKSTRLFSEGILQKFGVDITMVGIDELDSLASLIKPGKTRVIMLESPTNPMTRVIDLKKCVAIAKEHNIHTILDNSCAGFHQHGDVPVDVIVHSLSKFASGVGDVMGGAVMGSKELVKQIKNANVWNSDVLASDSALQIWKSMQTYELRTTRQSQNALAIARFLEAHPQVERVLYPGLASHPDHGIAKTQMKDFGCVIAFDVAGGEKAMRKVLNSLNCFNIAFGTGFTQSIANPAWLFYARSFPEAQEGKSAINHNTIRLSVGIEPEAELLADLEQALA